nr:MAG TPA: hypothetical protein [Caudoviricetes sp.]
MRLVLNLYMEMQTISATSRRARRDYVHYT